MESFVSVSTLLNLVLTVIWFISGIRDLQGKDPFSICRSTSITVTRSTAPSGRKRRRVLHAQQHRLSDLSLHTCYIADLPYHLRHRHRGRPSLFCTAASGICTMAPAPDGAVKDEKKHFRKFYGIASIPLRCTLSGQHLSSQVEPLHSILMVARSCCALPCLISYLCYTLSRDDEKPKSEGLLWKSSVRS